MILERIDILRNLNLWNEFVLSSANSRDASYFIAHNPSLWKVLSENFRCESEYYFLKDGKGIIGVLPGFRIKGKYVSVPIFPSAGLFTPYQDAKNSLYLEMKDKVGRYEIRDTVRFSRYCNASKVVCSLHLKADAETQMGEFKAKVRSQIRKGYSNGIRVLHGGQEMLSLFYGIYARNMHKLGSPVLSLGFFSSLLQNYRNGIARFFAAYYDDLPVGSTLVLSYGSLLEVGWASTLTEYNRFNPNMVLYWEMIKFAVESGMDKFSFGRATVGTGSYRFKKQWGSEDQQVYFNYSNPTFDIRKLSRLAPLWRILPERFVAKVGPTFRRVSGI